MNRARLMAGDTIVLKPDDGSVATVEGIIARSHGWAELQEVRTKLSDGSWASGVVALWPSGRWMWVRMLTPVSSEDGG